MARRRDILFLFSRGSRLSLIVLFTLLGAVILPRQLGATSPPSQSKQKGWIPVGRDLLEKGEYDLAIAHFNKQLGLAEARDREQLEILRYLAMLYWYADRNPEAIESCRRALGLDRKSVV
jgi:tetratricopeptide (TPR) repeat protein